MAYISIKTKQPFKGRIPDEIRLPVNVKPIDSGNSEYGVTIEQVVRRGERGWDEAVKRWMFHQGYGPEEDVLDEGGQ